MRYNAGMAEILPIISDTAPHVVIVALFLYYLMKRDKTSSELAKGGHDAISSMAEASRENKTAIEVLTEVMRDKK